MSTTLEVRVRPRAGRNEIVVSADGEVRVYVTAAPEGGKANEAVLALLAQKLGVPKRSVSLVRGHAGRDKLVAVEGLDGPQALARLSSG